MLQAPLLVGDRKPEHVGEGGIYVVSPASGRNLVVGIHFKQRKFAKSIAIDDLKNKFVRLCLQTYLQRRIKRSSISPYVFMFSCPGCHGFWGSETPICLSQCPAPLPSGPPQPRESRVQTGIASFCTGRKSLTH